MDIEREMAWLVARQYRKRARKLVVIFQEIEHSANAGKANTKEIVDDRRSTNHSKPNSAKTITKRSLSTAGVSNRD